MLVDSTVEAPRTDKSRRFLFGSLGGLLAFEQLLKINPLPLWGRQEGRTGLGTEVPDDDTGRTINGRSYDNTAEKANQPDEESQDDDSSHEIVNQEKDGVDLGCICLRLLPLPRDTGSDSHDVGPSFQ